MGYTHEKLGESERRRIERLRLNGYGEESQRRDTGSWNTQED